MNRITGDNNISYNRIQGADLYDEDLEDILTIIANG